MRIVSLFSGAGGLDLGFTQAGHEVVWANDNFHDAVATYRRNLGPHIVEADIASVSCDTLPAADMVMGGFPCQGFSVANVKRHVGDERNTLYRQLLRVVAALRPRFFLGENVRGLLTLEHGAVIAMIVNDFERLGYQVQYRLLNAADYGVPQCRQRVIIVGVRSGVNFDYHYPSPTHSRTATLLTRPWVGVGEALADLPDPDTPNHELNHTYSKYKFEVSRYLGHRPLDALKPAPTVTARGDDRGGVVILPHPNGLRRMSCRELATVQSFPRDYEFVGSLSSIYRQIGNAVPPLLARAVARQFNEKEAHATQE